jgi:hypothetical protein
MEKVTTEYRQGRRVEIKITDEYEDTPTFDRIGTNMFSGKLKPFQNLEIVMENLSAPAHWLFWRLFRLRDRKTNICILIAKDNIEAKRIARGYKELLAANIVMRIKRQHYLFNPKVWFPDKGNFRAVLDHWSETHKEKI